MNQFDLDQTSLSKNPMSNNPYNIVTEFFENDNFGPSAISEMQNIKNYMWREASLKLTSMFPKTNPEFIKNIYFQKSSDESLIDEDQVLEETIEEILKNQENSSNFEISKGTINSNDLDDQIKYLTSNFPDASPFYLKAIAIKNSDNPEVLEKFVQKNLSTRNYPKKNNFATTRTEESKTLKYPYSFNMEQFLNEFPNPIKVFESPERNYSYDLTSFELLKNHFRKLKISTISDAYTRSSFNTVKTFESLDSLKSELNKKRKKSSIPENIQILQEFTYIINKKEIIKFVKQKKEREEKMYQRMKDNNELLECECCYEEISTLSPFATTCSEGHVFCGTCCRKGTEEELAKGLVKIKCFADCKSEINIKSLEKVLAKEKFKVLLAKVQEQEVLSAKIEGLFSCPFCHFASIPDDDKTVFTCLNVDCGSVSCRLCKKLDHLPKECESIEKNKKARLILEEKMTAALVRKCISCGKEIIRDGGCNHMTCTCGATFCYFCGQPSTSYEHLNGRCGGAVNDVSGVIHVAREVENQLLNMDPNLKIDINSILPAAAGVTGRENISAHALKATQALPQFYSEANIET